MKALKIATSWRLSRPAHRLLGKLATGRGLSLTSTVETLIREAAARELPKEGK